MKIMPKITKWFKKKNKDMKRSEKVDSAVQVEPKKRKKFEMEEENKNAAMEELIRDAECCICLDVPRGTVNTCKNGHILCHSCETKMARENHGSIFNCPVCKVPYRPCRNNFLTKFLNVYYR